VALHPNMKFNYFQEEWKDRPEWIVSAQETVRTIWESSYKGSSTAHGVLGQGRPLEADLNPAESLTRWERKRLAVTQLSANVDMLQCFQQEAYIHPVRDVVGWWYDRLQDPRWKDLARMALTYLTIPAMSAEPERVFSGAKITLSDRRCRMGDDILEAVECLKSWQRDGMIAATKEEVKTIEGMLAALCEEDLV